MHCCLSPPFCLCIFLVVLGCWVVSGGEAFWGRPLWPSSHFLWHLWVRFWWSRCGWPALLQPLRFFFRCWAERGTVDRLRWDYWLWFPCGWPMRTLSWYSWNTNQSSACWSFLLPLIALRFPQSWHFGRRWCWRCLSWRELAHPRSPSGLHLHWCLAPKWSN